MTLEVLWDYIEDTLGVTLFLQFFIFGNLPTPQSAMDKFSARRLQLAAYTFAKIVVNEICNHGDTISKFSKATAEIEKHPLAKVEVPMTGVVEHQFNQDPLYIPAVEPGSTNSKTNNDDMPPTQGESFEDVYIFS